MGDQIQILSKKNVNPLFYRNNQLLEVRPCEDIAIIHWDQFDSTINAYLLIGASRPTVSLLGLIKQLPI